ncbi:glycosyltransferase [Collinsella tanakaei]|uniref:glycosyltransferase n=1 Tax=Collinsella tanakaei TaxID=626935 RepID=UPI0026E96D39|nr:glycosyltransferase [Collinsella tanakaei]
MSDNGSKTRVLHITMRWGEGRGGVKQFILNAVNALDSERYEQSVLSVGPVTGGDLGLDLHGPVVTRGDSLSLVLAAPRLERAIRSLTPDAVHIHCNNGLGMLYAEAARRAGCVVRVCHSHNTAVEDGCAVKRIANSVLKRRFSSAPTLRVACSELAGAYLFGDEPFEVVRNGIDVESFAFDPCARRDVRSRYGIDDNAMVLGHVGSGIPVKNTGFIIDLVRVLVDRGVNAHALLVGSGEEIVALHNHSIDSGVSERIHFAGTVGDSWRYYSAMDAFILPSFYEGLPISLIEAQANGLPCVASEVVSRESDVSGLVSFLPLSAGVEGWSERIASTAKKGSVRDGSDSANYCRAVIHAGFSLQTLGHQLEELYCE